MTKELAKKWENHDPKTDWDDVENPKILILRYLQMKREARNDNNGVDIGLIRRNINNYGFSTSKQGLLNMLNSLVDCNLIREIQRNGQLNEYMYLWESERESSRDDKEFREKMSDALGGKI